MLGKLAFAASVAASTAATWYGLSPDDTVTGQINLFKMAPNGQVLNGAATVLTGDREYPKINTLHCSWNSTLCAFLTGVGAPYTQDYIYGVDRATGQTRYKHQIPAGIYVGNLVLDWQHDVLYGVAFDPQRKTAQIASWDFTTGNYSFVLDITGDLRNGLVLDASVALSVATGDLYVGLLTSPDTPDLVLQYSLPKGKEAPAKLVGVQPQLFPLPAGIRTLTDPRNTSNVLLVGASILSEAMDREVAVIGSINEAGHFGLMFPFANTMLPTFTQRGNVPLFLTGAFAEFQGTFLAPVLPPFQPGPGPAPQIPYGLLWSAEFAPAPAPPRPIVALNQIDYFLAAAAGVPDQ